MELALIVLCWTLAVCTALVSLMLIAHLSAITDLAKAKLASEKRLH